LLQITINTFFARQRPVGSYMPLYILYYVRVLDAKDDWLGLLGTVTSMATIWRVVIVALGDGAVGRNGHAQTHDYIAWFLFPLAVGLSGSLWPILILAGINGLLVPGSEPEPY
jgi:hypothetical protein